LSFVAHPRAAAVTTEVVPLDAVPGAWDGAWRALAMRAAEPTAFAEIWFMRASIAHLPLPAGARLLAVWRGADMLGLLPLMTARHYGRVPVENVQNWVHYHCFLGTPLVRKGDEEQFWHAALETIDKSAWASSFLHLSGLVADGPVLAALGRVRRADIVHRSERALLDSDLSPSAYYETHVRKKKRKEIGRLQARLREQGNVTFEHLATDGPVDTWIEAFLTLEASGWKGRAGTALNEDPATSAFFTAAVQGAFAARKLAMLRLTVNGEPIAMLVNFITSPGSFSFKIAFDEGYARFSPGVLIQLENLDILNRKDVSWMDSCASEDHPMINSLWAERRDIVRVTVPLKGWQRRSAFSIARSLENTSALIRRIR
jgi:CelD/BcsL family acetyltransferase involved in cellulose biosynthesis